MTSIFGYCKSDPSIPIAQLDYGYIGKCQDISKLQNILQILRSGEEGYYPILEQFTEEQLAKKKPDSPLLEKVNKEMMVEDLPKDDVQIIFDELKGLSSAMNNQTENLKISNDTPKSPPIRTSNEYIHSENNKKCEAVPRDINKCKNVIPRSYKEWEKMEKQLDDGDVDEICKETYTNTDINDKSQLSKPAHELLTQQKSSCLGDKASEDQYYAVLNEKNKGNEAFRCGDFKEALIYYNRSLDILPLAATYNNRAITLIKLGQFQEALIDCEKVISMEPSNFKAYLRRGLANHSLGNLENASEDFTKVVELEPKNKRGKELLEKVLKELEKEQLNRKKNGKRLEIKEINSSEEMNNKNVNANEILENKGNITPKNCSIDGISINENKDSINTKKSSYNEALCERTETDSSKQKSVDEMVHSCSKSGEKVQSNNKNNDKFESLDSSKDFVNNNDIENNTIEDSFVDGDSITDTGKQEDEKISTMLKVDEIKEPSSNKYNVKLENLDSSKDFVNNNDIENNTIEGSFVDGDSVTNTEKQENEKTISTNLKVNEVKDADELNARTASIEQLNNIHNGGVVNSGLINKQAECKGVYDLPADVIDKKDKGNIFYKTGRYDEAFQMYTLCIHSLLDDKSDKSGYKEALAAFFSNRASCQMKIGNSQQCIHDCDKALQFSPSPKAYLKRATAYESLEKYLDAYVDYQNVIQLDPSSVGALQAFSRLGNVLRSEYGNSWREKLHKTDTIPSNRDNHTIGEEKPPITNNEIKNTIHSDNCSVEIANQNITQKMEVDVHKINEISSKESVVEKSDNFTDGYKQSANVESNFGGHDQHQGNLDNKCAQNEYNNQENDQTSKLSVDDKHTKKPVQSNNGNKGTGISETGNEKKKNAEAYMKSDDGNPNVADKKVNKENTTKELFLETKGKGNKCVQQGKYGDAAKYYTICINILPGEVTSYTNRALCLLKLKQPTKAIDDCSQALILQPDNVKALFRRAQGRKMMKEYKEALVDFTRILKLEPNNNAAKKEMEQCKAEFYKALRNIQAVNEAAKLHEASGKSRKVPIEEILSEAADFSIKGKLTTKIGKCPLAKDNPPVTSQIKKMSGFEFLHAWNNIKSNKTADYADLLTQIDFTKLPELLSNKLDGEILNNFIRTVNEQYTSKETYKQGIRLLKFLCRTPRFVTMVMFLNTIEKTLMRNTIDLLENRVKQSNEKSLLSDISSLRLSYR